MSALPVLQQDVDRADAVRVELARLLLDGSTGTSSDLPNLWAAAGVTPVPSFVLDLGKGIALAILRLDKNGTTKFPPLLPQYAKASLPSASANASGMIYVTDDVGGAVPAFSDGTNWRRVTDRSVVS